MPLDFRKEQAISLSEVSRFVPKRRGKKVHYSTVYRWATKGVRGRVLETTLSGGIRYTTVEAVDRFLAATPRATVQRGDDFAEVIDAALAKAGV